MGKRHTALPKQKLTRQKSKLLMKSGGELDDMMLGSVVEKMRKGGNAERIVKVKKGKDKKQKYKLGGWTHSD